MSRRALSGLPTESPRATKASSVPLYRRIAQSCRWIHDDAVVVRYVASVLMSLVPCLLPCHDQVTATGTFGADTHSICKLRSLPCRALTSPPLRQP
jgi:hypothetical protein